MQVELSIYVEISIEIYLFVSSNIALYPCVMFLLYVLQLLESCMKNCGNRFHTIAANKDILGDLTKILSSKVCLFCVVIGYFWVLCIRGRRLQTLVFLSYPQTLFRPR